MRTIPNNNNNKETKQQKKPETTTMTKDQSNHHHPYKNPIEDLTTYFDGDGDDAHISRSS